MRHVLALVFALLTAVSTAHAITITSGTIGAWQGGDFGGAYDIHGAGFDLVRFVHGVNSPISIAQSARGGAFNQPADFSHTVTLPFDIKGQLAWTIEPVTVSPVAPFTVTHASAPFTMTGILNGTDVDGAGTFTLGAQGHQGGWHVWSVDFAFSEATPTAGAPSPVPEPMTLFLVGTGLVAVGVWRRVRS